MPFVSLKGPCLEMEGPGWRRRRAVRSPAGQAGEDPPLPSIVKERSCLRAWPGRCGRTRRKCRDGEEQGAIPPLCPQDPAVLPGTSSCGTCPLQDIDADGLEGFCGLSPLFLDSHFPLWSDAQGRRRGLGWRRYCSPCTASCFCSRYIRSSLPLGARGPGSP